MEAQACGLPCIAFNTGGIKEIIRDNKTGFWLNHLMKMILKINSTFFE